MRTTISYLISVVTSFLMFGDGLFLGDFCSTVNVAGRHGVLASLRNETIRKLGEKCWASEKAKLRPSAMLFGVA